METQLESALGQLPTRWKSESRKYGEACELWLAANYYCPFCGGQLTKGPTNAQAVDHQCSNESCLEYFQIKATSKSFKTRSGRVRCLGASLRATLASIDPITDRMTWNLVLLEYDRTTNRIKKLGLIRKCNISRENVRERNPLRPTARRAGWQGCNLMFDGNSVECEHLSAQSPAPHPNPKPEPIAVIAGGVAPA